MFSMGKVASRIARASQSSIRGVVIVLLLMWHWLLATSATCAEAPGREIAVLFAGRPCGFEIAGRLQKDGLAVNVLPRPVLDGQLTWEKAKSYNVIVLCGLGQSNADFTLSDNNTKNIETLNRFLNEGGGILFIPCWGQMDTGIPPQEAFAKPLGLEPLFPEVVFDPETSVKATSWKIDFACTSDFLKDSPITRGASETLWYPVATRAGGQQHSTTFKSDGAWTVAVRGAKTSFTKTVPLDSGNFAVATPGSFTREVPLVAYRQVGKGRLVCLGITPEYLFSNVATTTLEGIVLDRGLRNVPSHGYTLFRNSLKWLAEPSAAEGFPLGGAKMDATLLENPWKTKFGKPFDWNVALVASNQWHPAAGKFPAANPAQPGLIGARTACSTGKGTVADWVAKAKEAGLSWIVFLEDFAALTPEKFAQLKADCAKQTNAGFAAIPGFVIDDEVGNHYFYFGTTFPYPEKKLLSEDGKVFASYDPAFDPKNPRPPGQLAMTTLTYAYTISAFRLTAGIYKKPNHV